MFHTDLIQTMHLCVFCVPVCEREANAWSGLNQVLKKHVEDSDSKRTMKDRNIQRSRRTHFTYTRASYQVLCTLVVLLANNGTYVFLCYTLWTLRVNFNLGLLKEHVLLLFLFTPSNVQSSVHWYTWKLLWCGGPCPCGLQHCRHKMGTI